MTSQLVWRVSTLLLAFYLFIYYYYYYYFAFWTHTHTRDSKDAPSSRCVSSQSRACAGIFPAHFQIRNYLPTSALQTKNLFVPHGPGKPKAENWFLDPAKDGDLISRIQHYSCQAFKALGLKDFGLFDFRVDHNGSPFFLECNLFCSFGPQSVLNTIAKDSAFTDKELFDLMVDNALLRRKNPLNGFHCSKNSIDA